MQIFHERKANFLLNLETLGISGQYDAFANEIIETAGQIIAPAGTRSHLWEIDLHGIHAEGHTDDEAFANWKRLARRSVAALFNREEAA